MTDKHSPLPWTIKRPGILDETGELVAVVFEDQNEDLIATAVNSHADLVEALKGAGKALYDAITNREFANELKMIDAHKSTQAALKKAGVE